MAETTTKPTGPSAYRQSHGSSDRAIVAAVRKRFADDEAVKALSNDRLIEIAGWAYTSASAIKKVTAALAAAQA